MGTSSVSPATMYLRSGIDARTLATCASAAWPSGLMLVLPESKRTSLGRAMSIRPSRITTLSLPASIMDFSLATRLRKVAARASAAAFCLRSSSRRALASAKTCANCPFSLVSLSTFCPSFSRRARSSPASAVVSSSFLRRSSRSAVSAAMRLSASPTWVCRWSIWACRAFSRSAAARSWSVRNLSSSATFLSKVPVVTQALVVAAPAKSRSGRQARPARRKRARKEDGRQEWKEEWKEDWKEDWKEE